MKQYTPMTLESFKGEFDSFLAVWMNESIKKYEAILGKNDILDYIRHVEKLIGGGGKRLRPYIMAITSQACGASLNQDVYRVALLLELFHNFALIHDDIVDLGTDRHGTMTLHRYVEGELVRRKGAGDTQHIARGQAMLLGDLLLSWTVRIWSELKTIPPEKIEAAKNVFYKMSEEVILGEIIDVDMTTRDADSLDEIVMKMELKTSRYTFVRPMQIGTALAGGDESMMTFAEKFGIPLGLAFQIQDDLADLVLDSEQSSKSVFSDIKTRQQTIFTSYIYEKGSPEARRRLGSFMGKNITPENRLEVRDLFRSSGALAYGAQKMNAYFDEALRVLEESGLGNQSKEQFRDLLIAIRQKTPSWQVTHR